MSQNETPSKYGSVAIRGMGVRVGVGVVIWGTGETMLLEKQRDCGWWGLLGGKN